MAGQRERAGRLKENEAQRRAQRKVMMLREVGRDGRRSTKRGGEEGLEQIIYAPCGDEGSTGKCKRTPSESVGDYGAPDIT